MCTSFRCLYGIGVRYVDGMFTPYRGLVGICVGHIDGMLDSVYD